MVNILPLFSVLVGVPSAIYLFRLATGAGIRNRQSRRLPLGWCAMPWEPLAWDRQVFFLCDSWYPKGCIAGIVDEYQNLDIICSARIDTVMYDLPPRCIGRHKCSRKQGERLSPENLVRTSPEKEVWRISVRPVFTRLWGGRAGHCHVLQKWQWKPQAVLLHKRFGRYTIDYRRCGDWCDSWIRGGIYPLSPSGLLYASVGLETSYYESKVFWLLARIPCAEVRVLSVC